MAKNDWAGYDEVEFETILETRYYQIIAKSESDLEQNLMIASSNRFKLVERGIGDQNKHWAIIKYEEADVCMHCERTVSVPDPFSVSSPLIQVQKKALQLKRLPRFYGDRNEFDLFSQA